VSWGLIAGVALLGCSRQITDPGVIYVDGLAAVEGDGRQESPYRTLRSALIHEGQYSHIMVAGDSVVAPSQWMFTEAVTIAGWGHAETVLVPEQDDRFSWSSGLEVSLSHVKLGGTLETTGGIWSLSQLGFSGVPPKIVASDSTLVVNQSVWEGGVGTVLSVEEGSVALHGVVINGVVPDEAASEGDVIVVRNATFEMVQSRIEHASERALVLSNSVASVRETALQGGTRSGLSALSGSVVSLSDVAVSDATINLFVGTARLDIVGGEVRNSGFVGVLAGENSALSILDTRFEANREGHISVLGPNTSVLIDGIHAQDAELDSCVSVTGTDLPVVVQNSILTGCAGTGFSGYQLGDVTVSGNEISDISLDLVVGESADGVSLLDSTGLIEKNHVQGVLGNGIAILRASARVQDNIIIDSGDAGIDLVDRSGDRSVFSGNYIEGASTAGVVVLNADADVIGNQIVNSLFRAEYGLGEGVAFGAGADVLVEDNDIEGSARSGVFYMDGASGTVRSNRISESGRYGIVEFCAPDFRVNSVFVDDNTLTDNAYGDVLGCP
jgi:hypothetical protein